MGAVKQQMGLELRGRYQLGREQGRRRSGRRGGKGGLVEGAKALF